MPYEVRSFETTPNPDALKCTLNPSPPSPAGGARRSYASPDEAEAAGDTLAMACFGVEGVVRVMVLGDFVTIGKRSDTKWAPIKKGLARALGAGA